MCVEDVLFVSRVSCDVYLGDALGFLDLDSGVERVIDRAHVDVVYVKQDSAVGAFYHFVHELPLRHNRVMECGVAADFSTRNRNFQVVFRPNQFVKKLPLASDDVSNQFCLPSSHESPAEGRGLCASTVTLVMPSKLDAGTSRKYVIRRRRKSYGSD